MTGSDIRPKQKRFVAAMMTTKTIAQAAAAVGVTERTGLRWLADPEVKRALTDAQTEALATVTRQAVGKMTEALNTLASIAGDEEAPAGSRVSAARAILENALRFNEALTLAERVAALEEKLSGGAR